MGSRGEGKAGWGAGQSSRTEPANSDGQERAAGRQSGRRFNDLLSAREEAEDARGAGAGAGA